MLRATLYNYRILVAWNIVMLDRLHVFVPFLPRACSFFRRVPRDAHAIGTPQEGGYISAWLDDNKMLELGVPLQSQIQMLPSGEVRRGELRHKWDKLSTGFTPMAFKVFPQAAGFREMPGIELKASPAKLLQGHNLCGPNSIEKGWQVMRYWLLLAYPLLVPMLDFEQAECYALDCTFSSKLPNPATAQQVIIALSGISSGQTKSRGNLYETSCYWYSRQSREVGLKAYLKEHEYLYQIKEYKKLGKSDTAALAIVELMENPQLLEYSKCQLRIEATLKKRGLEKRQIPYLMNALIEFQKQTEAAGGCLIKDIWQDVSKKLFDACEGQTMKTIEDGKVEEMLLKMYSKVNAKGKLNDTKARHLFITFRNLKAYGWEETKRSMAYSTFYLHINKLEAIGLSKASLQKLDNIHKNNVVPLLRFVTVDFSDQYPSWYVEPEVPRLLKAVQPTKKVENHA